jgi:hypothetical protein
MKRLPAGSFRAVLSVAVFWGSCALAVAQSSAGSSKPAASASTAALQRDFLAAIRDGDAKKFLSYIPEAGVNLGPQLQHVTRGEVEQQLLSHHGLYCKLFDSSCIDTAIKLDASERACSYRELLTHFVVRTAATETTRNGVRQAILVAEVKNDQCPSQRLIDFIFNYEAGGWKLFSMP